MAQIVVMGGGLVGLTAGMLLARDGHQVTVLERDAAGPKGRAGDLWQRWDRRGVNQFRQLHFMLPRWRAVMERELPEVIAGLETLGGVRTSMLGALPDEMTGGKRDGDERFETVTGRRPVLEAAVARVARCTDGLTVCLPARPGAAAAALRGPVDPHPAVRLRDLGRGLRHLGARLRTPRTPHGARLGSGPEPDPQRRALGRRARRSPACR